MLRSIFLLFMLACDQRAAARVGRVPDSLAGGPAWQHAHDRAVWQASRCHSSTPIIKCTFSVLDFIVHASSAYPWVASARVCASCAVMRSVRSHTACVPRSARMLQPGGGLSVALRSAALGAFEQAAVSLRRRCCRMVHFRRRWRAGRRRAQPALRLAPAHFSWRPAHCLQGVLAHGMGFAQLGSAISSTEELLGVCQNVQDEIWAARTSPASCTCT